MFIYRPQASRPFLFRRTPRGGLAASLLGLAMATSLATAALVAETPTIGVDEIERGQRGYGLTVFDGTTPERFEVEVIGVMRNVSPDRSWILARLSGRDLERIGVAQGMSGSPVYLDGRLAGAVAFSWGFARDPIAGITPIGEMRALSALPAPPAGTRSAARPDLEGPPLDLAAIAALDLPDGLLERELASLQPRLMEGASSSLQWSAAGFSGPGRDLLGRALGGLSPSGRMAHTAGAKTDGQGGVAKAEAEREPLVAGGPVSIVLMEGDLNLAASGTVTDTDGDHVLALGHALLGLGPIDLPMARSEVLTIFSSLNTSFKISNQGEVVGAFHQDREAGMLGKVGAVAPMIPVSLTIRGGAEHPELDREYQMRVAHLPGLTPALIATSLLGALQTASYVRGEQALDLTAELRIRGYPPLHVEQSFDGGNAVPQAAGYLLSIAAYLLENTLEEVEVEAVRVVVDQRPGPRIATLVGAYAERTTVRPGEKVLLNLEFLAYRGEPFRRSLELRLPPELPAGRYSVLVGDGPTIDAARLEVEAVVPRRFPQALELLRGFHSRRDLVALGLYASRGLAVNGQPMPSLPGSMRSLLGGAGGSDAVPLRLAVAQHVTERLDFPFAGGARVDFEVQRREPVSAVPTQEGQSDSGPEDAETGEAAAETRSAEPPKPPSQQDSREDAR